MKYPKVLFKISEFKVWLMRLSNQGYGTIKELEEMPIDKFFDLIHYEKYISKYSDCFRLLNKKQ